MGFSHPVFFCIITLGKKMKVIKSEIMGFCFGVRRAVELVKNALSENQSKKVYSLGPLIHNDFVLESLKNQGLIISEEDEIQNILKAASDENISEEDFDKLVDDFILKILVITQAPRKKISFEAHVRFSLFSSKCYNGVFLCSQS